MGENEDMIKTLKDLGVAFKSETEKNDPKPEITIDDIVDHIDKPCQDGDTPCKMHKKIDQIKQEAMEKGLVYGSELEKRKHG